MGEKISLSEIEIPIRSTKRRITEEETIIDVSIINIDRVQICEDIVNQESSDISIYTIGRYQLMTNNFNT